MWELWIQFSCFTLPLQSTPVNNRTKLISPETIESLGYNFCRWQSACFRTVLSESQKYTQIHDMPICKMAIYTKSSICVKPRKSYIQRYFVWRYRLGYNGAPIGNGTWVPNGHVPAGVTWPYCRCVGVLGAWRRLRPSSAFSISLEILKDKHQFLQHENCGFVAFV